MWFCLNLCKAKGGVCGVSTFVDNVIVEEDQRWDGDVVTLVLPLFYS